MPLAVLIVEATPQNVHGVASRWLTKIGPTTYVGHLSTRVRDNLWAEIAQILGAGRATLVFPEQNEQGFALRSAGQGRYVPLDYDGLMLIAFEAQNHETITER
jgi:CRISPR-associated protein Cas2